jgi:hypothetical protein
MKKVYHLFWTALLFASLIQPAFGQDKEITVTGKVTDTAGTAIPEAMVVLGGGIMITGDTAYTGNDGCFNTKINVNQNAYGIVYRISKSGYITKTGYGMIDSTNNTADLGTVALAKGISQKITVTGRVIDSTTGVSIENALVRLSTMQLITDTIYDSAYTDKDGKFSHEMDPSTWVTPRLLYLVTKDGYQPKYGTANIVGTSVDLGDIRLAKDPVSIAHPNTILKSNITPTGIALYSLRGQLLFSGKEVHLPALVAQGIVNAQPVIAVYKQGNKEIYRKSILLKK